MMALAKKSIPVSDLAWELEEAEDRTIERRVRVVPRHPRAFETKLTRRMPRIDPQLLALARGETEKSAPPAGTDAGAEDPFGGLIPVNDDDEAISITDVDAGWMSSDVEPEPFPT